MAILQFAIFAPCVRRGSPDPADGATEGLLKSRETFGRALWLGPPLFAAVPETGHNYAAGASASSIHSGVKWRSSGGSRACLPREVTW